MNKKELANKYLEHLENGDVEKVIDLFNENGIVDSPIYGIKKANQFYHELKDDTTNSKLYLKGIFEQNDSNDLALYFTYKWTLKNNTKVEFDVVDIIELDSENKISKLKIIYDTVIARKLVEELN
ncbi:MULTISPECIES: nuclear transport factor 2 family protein [unclassified Tenacibaculum]|uniref:nuclear transport factor 2 family protein n=1 Tax=unclassified Tenacibaculum TaxID=2635139 RepID=UPI001F46B109|nr:MULTISPECIES: nuclear transport factor 2 family protein [unclassified Tenacibaculum]MCF2873138.1 nuclear transport factor 2 family protein [Tenacibaculum sp. Cn5-1]MCF2933294.1 nuclear transport factor 2 family protein [Tenacibaculum sp. Cn5-34]MCG7510125.1 nuclear transport factor 2 family protein [Tenacibaculum sp. Cn5-46]